jgi:site-specific recombinase XerD
VVNEITVQKKNMKKKIESRTVPISHEVKRILKAWIQRLEHMGLLRETRFLFCSQEQKQKAITRQRAWQILKDVFSKLRLTGKLATHTLRKTCAARLYEYFKGDLVKLQKALGHKNINSTISYISFLESDVFNGFLAI